MKVVILPWTMSSQAIEFLYSYFVVLGGRLRNDDGYTRTGTLFYDKGFLRWYNHELGKLDSLFISWRHHMNHLSPTEVAHSGSVTPVVPEWP